MVRDRGLSAPEGRARLGSGCFGVLGVPVLLVMGGASVAVGVGQWNPVLILVGVFQCAAAVLAAWGVAAAVRDRVRREEVVQAESEGAPEIEEGSDD